ncbi:MAG TPA: hypothetical protein V6D43_19540 [Candidatus Sericytochromatia bacterium]
MSALAMRGVNLAPPKEQASHGTACCANNCAIAKPGFKFTVAAKQQTTK